MQYIDTQTGTYPLTERRIRIDNPQTSFPKQFASDRYKPVKPTSRPQEDFFTGAREIAPELVEGEYRQAWETYAIERTPEEIAEELEARKVAARRQVDVIRDQHIFRDSIPYTFPGDTEPDGVQLRDERDRQNIQDNMIDAQSLAPETVMHFMPTSNQVKAMTAAQMLDMGAFLKGRGDAIYAAAWTKKGEVGAAATLEQLQAVDLNTGWPE